MQLGTIQKLTHLTGLAKKPSATATRSKLPFLNRQLGDLSKSARTLVGQSYASSLQKGLVFGEVDRDARRRSPFAPHSGLFAVDHASGILFADFDWPNPRYTLPAYMHAFPPSQLPVECQNAEASDEIKALQSSGETQESAALYDLRQYDSIGLASRVQKITSIGSGLVAWIQASPPQRHPQETWVHVGASSLGAAHDRHAVVHEAAFYAHIQDLAALPGNGTSVTFLKYGRGDPGNVGSDALKLFLLDLPIFRGQ
jgi:hypothetical protein